MSLLTHAISFLVGTATGAAGQYFAIRFTDQRKKQEQRAAVKEEFEHCRKQMPELFEEISNDIAGNPLKSEFVLLDVRLRYGRFPEQPFVYFMNDQRNTETYKDEKEQVLVHSHLLDKVKRLESCGFVWDVSRTSVPYFRMSDEFKVMLRS